MSNIERVERLLKQLRHSVIELSREAFFGDVGSAKSLLEDLGGQKVRGYRAPSFSIDYGNPWAFDGLLEAGYRYSSSLYSVQHDQYGMPDAPRFPYEACPELTEIPITTTRLLGRYLLAGGGGYFGFERYRVSHWELRRVNALELQPSIFYLHPWEIDPGQPRVPGTTLNPIPALREPGQDRDPP